jgi:hypothetical protein
MDDILIIYDDILNKNELDVIEYFKNLKCPCKTYLKAIEFINYYRQNKSFTKTLFIYIECVANNYHLKLLTNTELNYLYDNVSYNECNSYKIYNTLVNTIFVKNIIKNTWLDIIVNYNELIIDYLNPYTNISNILSTIMKYYSDIKDINENIILNNNKLINFNHNEYLVKNKFIMHEFINYIENITQNKLSIYIKSFIYNYQFNIPNSNSSSSSSNKDTSSKIEINNINNINYLRDENDIECESLNIYIENSRFKLNVPFEMIVLSKLSSEYYDRYIINNYNKYNKYNKLNLYDLYLKNGLIYLGNCYESMNMYTHFLYDTNIERFILFNINGIDCYDISNNENEIFIYMNKNRNGRYDLLHKYLSMYQNEDILHLILDHNYKSYISDEGKFKNALNYI